MSLGASKDWRTVLQTMTGETELSTKGILSYFSPLQDFLQTETIRLASIDSDMDKSAPMIVGAIALFLFLLIVVLYCVKKRDRARKMFSVCGLSKNGSLDIVTNEMPQKKIIVIEGVSEDKVWNGSLGIENQLTTKNRLCWEPILKSEHRLWFQIYDTSHFGRGLMNDDINETIDLVQYYPVKKQQYSVL